MSELEQRNIRILEDKISGLTYNIIGEKYGICIQRVSQIAKKEKRIAISNFRLNYPHVFEFVCCDYLYKYRPDISKEIISQVMDIMVRTKRLQYGFYSLIPQNNKEFVEVLKAVDNFKILIKLYDSIGGYSNAMKYAEKDGTKFENRWCF